MVKAKNRDDEVQDAVERKKKARQDYKASGKDKSMRNIKKKEYLSCKATKQKY